MAKVVVTGGSGKLGRACVRDLLDAGFLVINADLVAPAEQLCPFVKVDLTDMLNPSIVPATGDVCGSTTLPASAESFIPTP